MPKEKTIQAFNVSNTGLVSTHAGLQISEVMMDNAAALPDENGEVPQTLKDELRGQALTQVLADAKTVTTQITFQLMEQDGQWWILPDQAMLDVLSGAVK